MTDADVVLLTTRLVWGAFAIGIAFGAIAQRTHFCAMGAVVDIVVADDWGRMRMWALAAGVAIIGFAVMSAAGWVRAADSIYAGRSITWASHAVGGLMFGFGMVLASGCAARNLVRIGGGNLKAFVVMTILGASALATLKGVGATARVASVDLLRVSLPVTQDLPSLAAFVWPGSPAQWAMGIALPIGAALIAWALWRRSDRSVPTLLGGVGTGLLVAAMWGLSGRIGHLSEDPRTLEEAFLATSSGRMVSLSFVAPAASSLESMVLYSDASQRMTIGVASAIGVVIGSAAVALILRRFRWEGFSGVEDTANHLVGAALMGAGGITALGCTIGQGISGVSTLSLGSFIVLAAILAGAVLGLRWQVWRIDRTAR